MYLGLYFNYDLCSISKIPNMRIYMYLGLEKLPLPCKSQYLLQLRSMFYLKKLPNMSNDRKTTSCG